MGDIVVADGLVQHDFDAAPIGFVRGCLCMGDPGAPTVFTPDEPLSALLARTAGDAAGAQRVHRGLIATGDRFISGAAEKAAIRSAFPSAMAAEMEGGAVAQAASMSGVPFAVVRAISDLADGTAAASFEQFEQHAADISAPGGDAGARAAGLKACSTQKGSPGFPGSLCVLLCNQISMSS